MRSKIKKEKSKIGERLYLKKRPENLMYLSGFKPLFL